MLYYLENHRDIVLERGYKRAEKMPQTSQIIDITQIQSRLKRAGLSPKYQQNTHTHFKTGNGL